MAGTWQECTDCGRREVESLVYTVAVGLVVMIGQWVVPGAGTVWDGLLVVVVWGLVLRGALQRPVKRRRWAGYLMAYRHRMLHDRDGGRSTDRVVTR